MNNFRKCRFILWYSDLIFSKLAKKTGLSCITHVVTASGLLAEGRLISI